MRVKVIIACFFLFLARDAMAQKHPNVELGFNADRLYHLTDLDSVNLYNGNLILRIPLGDTYPANAEFRYGLTLVYNGKFWDFHREQEPDDDDEDSLGGDWHTISDPNRRSNAGVGWRVSLGRLLAPDDASSITPGNETNRWIYEGPAGDEHPFESTVFGAENTTPVLRGVDQDHLRMVLQSDGARNIEFPNGDIHRFQFERGRWRLRTITDRFGNFLKIDSTWYTPSNANDGREASWTLTDSTGRTHTVVFRPFPTMSNGVDAGQNVDVIRLATVGGQADYEFVYEEVNVPWAGSAWPGWYADHGDDAILPVLKKIVLPGDVTSFRFTYYSSGALESVGLPTGGELRYEYQEIDLPQSFCYASSFAGRNPGVKSRTTPDGRWDYAYTLAQPATNPDPQQSVEDCDVQAPDSPGAVPLVQPLIRWSRASVLSPPVPFTAGSTTTMRRVRTDHYFYTWPEDPAPADPWNLIVDNTPTVYMGQPITTGAPAVGTAGPDVEAVDVAGDPDRRFLSTRIFEGCADNGDCADGRFVQSSYLRFPKPFIWNWFGDSHWIYPVTSTRTVFNEDTGCGGTCWVQSTNSEPDGVGKYRKSETTTNFPLGGAFSTFTNYAAWSESDIHTAAKRWLLHSYDRAERIEQGMTQRTDFCFDPVTGFLNGNRVLRENEWGAHDVLTLYTNDAKGNVEFERNFGGDTQALKTDTACGGPATAGAAPQYLIRHSYFAGLRKKSEYCDPTIAGNGCTSVATVLDLDIDASSARPTKSRDVSGVATGYVYTPIIGLLEKSTPAGAAATDYLYHRETFPHSVDVITAATAGAVKSTITFDGFGRVSETKTLIPSDAGESSPSSWALRTTRYDGLGRRAAVSEPYAPGETPALFTSTEYDAFARPTRVTAPDGAVVRYSYSGTREMTRITRIKTAAGEIDVPTTERYDARGRLREVHEHSGPSGGIVVTKYEYDIGGRLVYVETTGTEVNVADGSPVQQRRLFIYDSLGFLRMEKHPEMDAVYYAGYDARGHAALRTLEDPYQSDRAVTPHDLRFTYDAAERLRMVEMQDPAATYESFLPLKLFEFGSSNGVSAGGTNWTLGKLVSAARWNYDPESPVDDVVKVTEEYEYADTAGRKTQRTTLIERGGLASLSPVRTITQSVTYNDLGLPATVRYPSCAYCAYTGTKEVRNQYSAGMLTKIDRVDVFNRSSTAASMTYWPTGLWRTIAHGNGMIDRQDVDVVPRPKQISFGDWQACTALSGLTLTASATTIDPEDEVELQVSATGTMPLTYEWYAHPPSSEPLPPQAVVTVMPTVTTEYTVFVSNECSTKSSTITVTVEDCAPPEIHGPAGPQRYEVAAGSRVTMSMPASGTAPLAYAWFTAANPGNVLGTEPAFVVPAATQTVSYVSRVSNGCGSIEQEHKIVVALDEPKSLTATRTNAGAVTLTWSGSPGAQRYRLERKAQGASFQQIATVTTGSYIDTGVTSGLTYVYRVYAEDADGDSRSQASNRDLATMMTFTPVASGTVISAAPITELITALNAVGAANGWAAVTWQQILPVGTPVPMSLAEVRGEHLSALRSRMDAALQALGVVSAPYADDPILNESTPVKAGHFSAIQLRAQ